MTEAAQAIEASQATEVTQVMEATQEAQAALVIKYTQVIRGTQAIETIQAINTELIIEATQVIEATLVIKALHFILITKVIQTTKWVGYKDMQRIFRTCKLNRCFSDLFSAVIKGSDKQLEVEILFVSSWFLRSQFPHIRLLSSVLELRLNITAEKCGG